MEPQEFGGRIFTLNMIADYCKDCVEWSDAKPIVEMLNSLMLGNCTPDEAEIIRSIKFEFKNRVYGNTYNAPVGQVLEHVERVENLNH